VVTSFSAQVLAGVVGVLQQVVAKLEQPLPEECELRVVHVVLLRRLEDVLLGELRIFFAATAAVFAAMCIPSRLRVTSGCREAGGR